ncbi:MAG TPA: penicillin-binding protein 2, partial [Chitinophagales bacterium]
MKDLFKDRYQIVQVIIAVFASIFVLRLGYLQLVEKKYRTLARNNAIKEVEVYPTRGMVYDRNGELIVFNEAIYDIMLVPRMAKNVDSTKLCELLGITKDDYAKRFAAAKNYSTYKSSFFMKQVSMETYSRFQEFLYLFPGFYGQVRTIRSYPNHCGALL